MAIQVVHEDANNIIGEGTDWSACLDDSTCQKKKECTACRNGALMVNQILY